ncbi:MAG: BrnT family toxin [Methylococcaceae bacterium]
MKHEILTCVGFQWDEGNSEKNWISHQVTKSECEQLFFNQPLLIADDEKHSEIEKRYYALGQTDDGRLLFIVSTIRANLIRVISARDMSKKERGVYQK